MWIPKCCNSQKPNINGKMRNQVSLYYQQLLTNTQNGVQNNSYTPNLVLTKRCYIKDRSAVAQDTAINNGVQDAGTSKELIFQYFDVTSYKFNEVEWSGTKFKVLSTISLASVMIDGIRYIATDQRPFISILVGMKKL